MTTICYSHILCTPVHINREHLYKKMIYFKDKSRLYLVTISFTYLYFNKEVFEI